MLLLDLPTYRFHLFHQFVKIVTKPLRGVCLLVKGYCLPHNEFFIIIIIIILSSLLERVRRHYRMIHALNLREVCSLWGNVCSLWGNWCTWMFVPFAKPGRVWAPIRPPCSLADPCTSHIVQPFSICGLLFSTVSNGTLYFLFNFFPLSYLVVFHLQSVLL